MLGNLLKLLLLSSCLLVLCSCITIPNTKACSVAGVMSAGAICATTITHETSDMTLDEFLDFLEPQESTGKGAAICQSAEDWNKMKTALETACRMLGKRCSYEMKKAIE
jgi:hypothetical protein